MRIAVVAPSQIPSSTANSIQVMKVCQALVQAGCTTCLWVPGTAEPDWSRLSVHYGISVPFEMRWLHAPLALRRYDFAWKALRQAQLWGADAIYTWMLQAAVLALWWQLPTLLEMHMLPSGKIGPWLYRQVLRSSTKKRVLFITDALRRKLEAAYGSALGANEMQIAPMGIELERYRDLPATPEAARQALGLNQGLTAAYTGHFYAGRGMDLLLDLAKAFPLVQFLWVGGRPDDVAAWRQRLAAAGLKNVTLTGFVENSRMPLYQASADVLLMPYGSAVSVSSRGDTAEVCSPMKMFEYMAAGRAIISSDLPVLREVLNPSNAILCPPDEVDAWKQALTGLIADPQQRCLLGERAKKDANNYDWRERAVRSIDGFVEV